MPHHVPRTLSLSAVIHGSMLYTGPKVNSQPRLLFKLLNKIHSRKLFLFYWKLRKEERYFSLFFLCKAAP